MTILRIDDEPFKLQKSLQSLIYVNLRLWMIVLLTIMQSKNGLSQSNPVSASPNGNVIPQPWKSASGKLHVKSSRIIDLGDPTKGDTLGLEGVLFVVDGNRDGYTRWDCLLQNSDGTAFKNDLSLELKLDFQFNPSNFSVTAPIAINAGDQLSRTSLLIPINNSSPIYNWRNATTTLKIRVTQDGASLSGLSESSTYLNPSPGSGIWPSNSVQHSLLLVSDELVQSKNRSDWSIHNVTQDFNASSSVTADIIFASEWKVLLASNEWIHPIYGLGVVERLPTNWVEFGSRSVLILAKEDFPKLNTLQREALLDYALAGGRITFAMNNLFEMNAEDELFNWLKTIAADRVNSQSFRDAIDREVHKSGSTLDNLPTISLGFGELRLSKEPINSFAEYIGYVPNKLQPIDNTFRAESQVMTWNIPGVGQPPVILFSIFICLFSVIAGPILLWWAQYYLRRPMILLFAFPLLALLITFSILTYSVLKDGFETHARTRSITWIDQATHRGISFFRQTCFATIPPAGLTFSKSSEVWPTMDGGYNQRLSATHNIQMRLSDDQQIFSGILKPREQCQWTVTTPVKSLEVFDYRSNPKSGKLIKIQNKLPDDWLIAIFCDHDGDLFQACETKSGQQALELLQIDRNESRKLLNQYFVPLAFPPGFTTQQSGSVGAWLTNDSSYYENSVYDQVIHNEWLLRRWMGSDESLRAGEFLIIVKEASFLDQPLGKNVRDSDSFHVIVGRW